MGVFDAKNKILSDENLKLSPLEEEIAEKMSKSGILEALDKFMDEQAAAEPWLTKCQGYYDGLRRSVRIHEDLFAINWLETVSRTLASGKRVLINEADKAVELHFTDYGYIPLHNYVNAQGNEEINIDRVLFLWGIIVRDRMKKRWPKCSFSPVYQNLGEATFTYTVPAAQWKDWF